VPDLEELLPNGIAATSFEQQSLNICHFFDCCGLTAVLPSVQSKYSYDGCGLHYDQKSYDLQERSLEVTAPSWDEFFSTV
jgi:hypothetical protein